MPDTLIEWADATWAIFTGCTIPRLPDGSPRRGCFGCYARATHNKRHKAFKAGKKMAPQYAIGFDSVQVLRARFELPLSWRKPKRVFVNSTSDTFHEEVPDDDIARVWATMAVANWHTFQVLTKRPERMRAWLTNPENQQLVGRYAAKLAADRRIDFAFSWPLRNVWLGVSAEDQKSADYAIPHLIASPAAVRFLSCEPLLEPLDISIYLAWIHWCIVGGESGSSEKARPFDPAWARGIVLQCRDAGTAPFIKQMGRNAAGLVSHDLHGKDTSLWPPDLVIREYPDEVPA